MSTAVFPTISTLPGLTFPVVRTPVWDTFKHMSISGKVTAQGKRTQPIYSWEVKYSVLRLYGSFTEFQTLLGFFDARFGGADTFLYPDDDDNTATAQGFGTGDGVTALFQLTYAYGGNAYPCLAPHTVTDVKVAGTPATLGTGAGNYNVTLWGGTYLSGGGASTDNPGTVRFGASAIPTAGQALTWDGTYYFPARFSEDKCAFKKFSSGRYAVEKLGWDQVI